MKKVNAAKRSLRHMWLVAAVMLTTTAVGFATAGSADASVETKGLDGCATTKAVKSLFVLIWDNIINPIKAYGWYVVGAGVVLGCIMAAFSSRGNKGFKIAGWVIVAMTVGLGLVALVGNPSSITCK